MTPNSSNHPSSPPDVPPSSNKHLPGLDGIRGLAIIAVMFSHFIIKGDNLSEVSIIGRFLHSGYLGVDLFFVLSGFLITGILIDSKNSPAFFRVFYMRRALRIFPLYYGVLAASWLTVIFITPENKEVLVGQDSMLWYWLYASNIGMAIKGHWLEAPTWVGLGHFWSLAVEEQFYLVWPLLVFLIPVKRLKIICLVLMIVSPLVWLALLQWIGPVGAYTSTLGRVGELAAGSWLAVLWRDTSAWPKINRWLWPLCLWTGVLLLLERTICPWLSFFEMSLITLLSVAMVGLAARAHGTPLLTKCFTSPLLRWFGKYSYGIYVYHHALHPVWSRYLWEGWITKTFGTGWPATLCYVAAATACSLLLAWLSWKWIESPILSLKSKFSYRSRS